MALDTVPEEDAILQRLKANLWSGRVYDELPDETDLARDTVTGLILPYIVLTFGTLFPSGQDQSIEGAAQQPHVLPFVAECWGATKNDARAGGTGVIKLLTGWRPSENNASEITLTGGGGGFANYDQGRPVRFLRPVAGSCLVNMSIDDALD
ncbi:MAG: hypothetical protein K0S70_120 [Microbacterium sp.]|jgi:hypothetical protein|nr:hypothetical protein [Microbacterium sp.]